MYSQAINRPDKKDMFFLLGGHDLEMVEIRKLLEGEGLHSGRDFLDFGLNWGAKLSSYQGHFHQERWNVGIELIEDICRPERYIQIDHHNEIQSRPSAIKQVADLLDIQLSRWQQLVAANDAGYIPEMLQIGATQQEILEIRKQDRACQGVTEEEEALAVKSINQLLREENGVAIIQALCTKFSPITDLLYGKYEKLIIYRSNELTYYGKNKTELENIFAELMQQGIAYSGGGANGFWGIGSNKLSNEKIQEIVSMIPNIVNEKKDIHAHV